MYAKNFRGESPEIKVNSHNINTTSNSLKGKIMQQGRYLKADPVLKIFYAIIHCMIRVHFPFSVPCNTPYKHSCKIVTTSSFVKGTYALCRLPNFTASSAIFSK